MQHFYTDQPEISLQFYRYYVVYEYSHIWVIGSFTEKLPSGGYCYQRRHTFF
jgi:hypothetical protein